MPGHYLCDELDRGGSCWNYTVRSPFTFCLYFQVCESNTRWNVWLTGFRYLAFSPSGWRLSAGATGATSRLGASSVVLLPRTAAAAVLRTSISRRGNEVDNSNDKHMLVLYRRAATYPARIREPIIGFSILTTDTLESVQGGRRGLSKTYWHDLLLDILKRAMEGIKR